MKKRGNKSQVSAFVIIGLVLIIVIAIAIYVVSILNQPPNKEEQYTEVVPPAMEPLKNHYEQCLLETSKEAFIIAGQQGGYIYPDRARIIPIDGRETSSKGIHLVPGTNITIPYWWYLSSSNDCSTCQFKTQMPDLQKTGERLSIESEVEAYILENFKDCIDHDEFDERGFEIEEPGELFVEVEIGEDDVGLFMEYPLEVKYQNKLVKMSKFQNKLDLDIASIYDIARAITIEWQTTDTKAFEYVSVQLLSGYSLESSDYDLPPIAGPVKFGFNSPKMWVLTDVKEDVKTILTQNIPLVQVIGSKGYNLFVWESDMSYEFYDSFVMPVSSVPRSDLEKVSVNFDYLPWWDIYVKVHPSSGYIIMPDSPFSVNLILFRFSMQQYDFSYDLSYPIMVTLKNPTTLDGDGYTFQFALESNVRNNMPLNNTPFNLARDEGALQTLFGNPNQRSARAKITTINSMTGEPVDKALISYHCGQDLIHLGETLMQNDQAVLESKVPPCHGAVLSAFKDGFVSNPYGTTFVDDDFEEIELNLSPIVTKKIEVKKRMLVKKVAGGPGFGFEIVQILNNLNNMGMNAWASGHGIEYWEYVETAQDMALDDRVLIIMERKSEYEEDFAAMATFTGENTEGQTVDIAEGQYAVEVVMFREFGENKSRYEFVIPEREDCEGGGLFSDEECYTIPEIKFNSSFYLGAANLDETTGYFNVTAEDLEKDTMTVYVIAVTLDDIKVVEDLELMDMYDDFAGNNLTRIMPVFS